MQTIEFSVLAIFGFVCFMVVFSKVDQDSYDSVKRSEEDTGKVSK